MRLRRHIRHRPRLVRSGEIGFQVPRRWVELNAEQAITVEFVARRQLFGHAYGRLQPDYFHDMPQHSGVFLLLFTETRALAPRAQRPGDIALIVLPYEGDELVLERTLAVEIKIVRATYDKQGRSPNEFGFSQAAALRELGFPY